MLQKILVALDDSNHYKTVFAAALDIAKTMNARLLLLHILSLDEPTALALPVFSGYYPTVSEDLIRCCQEEQRAIEARGLARLQALADEAQAAGITAEIQQNIGDPGRSICAIASHWSADLIVIGRRGQSQVSEFFLGSVSNFVLHHAPCSVWVVQPQAENTQAENKSGTPSSTLREEGAGDEGNPDR